MWLTWISQSDVFGRSRDSDRSSKKHHATIAPTPICIIIITSVLCAMYYFVRPDSRASQNGCPISTKIRRNRKVHDH